MSRNGCARPPRTTMIRPACSTTNSRGSPGGAVTYTGAAKRPTRSRRGRPVRTGGVVTAAVPAGEAVGDSDDGDASDAGDPAEGGADGDGDPDGCPDEQP